MRTCNARKLICFGVAITATLSVIGTGFCLWIFTKDNELPHAEASLSINVSSDVENGSFNKQSLDVEGDLYLAEKGYIFPRMLVFEEGNGNKNDLTKGLNFYKMVSNYGENRNPNYTEFTNEPYLRDDVKITYYRDMEFSDEELKNGGLEFKLEAEISITNQLSKYLTLLDKFKAVRKLTPIGATNPPEIYKFDYTEHAFKIGTPVLGSTIKDLCYTPIDDNKMYQQYDFIMNFSKIFRYVSVDKKPLDKQKYWDLEQLCKNESESLSFNFYASYRGIK